MNGERESGFESNSFSGKEIMTGNGKEEKEQTSMCFIAQKVM